MDNSVGATTATEANSDENQDAGDTNWNEDCGLLKLVICVLNVHDFSHFQGRGSHNEVPSCPKSSRDCWKKSMKCIYDICLPRISGLKWGQLGWPFSNVDRIMLPALTFPNNCQVVASEPASLRRRRSINYQ